MNDSSFGLRECFLTLVFAGIAAATAGCAADTSDDDGAQSESEDLAAGVNSTGCKRSAYNCSLHPGAGTQRVPAPGGGERVFGLPRSLSYGCVVGARSTAASESNGFGGTLSPDEPESAGRGRAWRRPFFGFANCFADADVGGGAGAAAGDGSAGANAGGAAGSLVNVPGAPGTAAFASAALAVATKSGFT